MKKISLMLLIVTIALFSCKSASQKEEKTVSEETAQQTAKQTTQQTVQQTDTIDVSMFPVAQESDQQHIIELPFSENEDANKVEIFVTKTMEVDCNDHWLAGQLETKELSGWGYNYYQFNTDGEVMSTMMACPDENLTEKDIAAESLLLRYNSKVPIVVYTPKGYKVKYKIWSTTSKENVARTPKK